MRCTALQVAHNNLRQRQWSKLLVCATQFSYCPPSKSVQYLGFGRVHHRRIRLRQHRLDQIVDRGVRGATAPRLVQLPLVLLRLDIRVALRRQVTVDRRLLLEQLGRAAWAWVCKADVRAPISASRGPCSARAVSWLISAVLIAASDCRVLAS